MNNLIQNIEKDISINMKKELYLFSIIWNLFEDKLYRNNFGYNGIRTNQIIDNLVNRIDNNKKVDDINSKLLKYNEKFENDPSRVYLEYVIRDNEISFEDFEKMYKSQDKNDKIRVLILLISRIRNNMFHGIKKISSLNNQENLFHLANEFLAFVLEENNVSI